jgi:hypothetical protein
VVRPPLEAGELALGHVRSTRGFDLGCADSLAKLGKVRLEQLAFHAASHALDTLGPKLLAL